MNRVPRREGGRKNAGALETKINILMGMAGLIVILLVILILLSMRSVPTVNHKINKPVEVTENDNSTTEAVNETAVEPVVSTPETGDLPPAEEFDRAVRIEVLNGEGSRGIAKKYGDLLRDEGYDIRDMRNANRMDYKNSFIYDRTGLQGQAQLLGELLGIPSQRIIRQNDPALVDIDLTVIIGDDYSDLNLQP